MERRRDVSVRVSRLFRRAQVRRLAIRVLLISSVVSGLFLSAYSVVSEPRLVAQETTAGTAANGVSFEDLGFSGYGLIESSLTVDLCGVSFYFLNEDEAEQYNDTGELPAPDLHCEKTRASLPGDISDLVVRSTRTTEANYTISFSFYVFAQPYSILALPALFLALGGSVGLLAILLRWGLGQMVKELSEQESSRKEK